MGIPNRISDKIVLMGLNFRISYEEGRLRRIKARLAEREKENFRSQEIDSLGGFKKGDVVRLKSGGPEATIVCFYSTFCRTFGSFYTNDRVTVWHYDHAKKETVASEYPPEVLMKV